MKTQRIGYKLLALLSCIAMLGIAGNAFALHPAVPLYDKDAGPVTVANGAAISSKMTCGWCHDYDNIEQHSYHSLLGSNELKGWMAYNPNSSDKYKKGVATKGKSWVQSPGHVGKW